MLGVYEYTVPRGTTEVDTVAVQMMNLIYSHLDGNILNGLSKQKPDWVSIDSEETILDVISFGFQGTQYCILAVIDTSNQVYIKVFFKTIRRMNNYNIASFSRASFGTGSKTYRFLIGVHSDYFIISEIQSNSSYQSLTIKVDVPTNPDDKNVFITLTPNSNAYNKAFGTEDIIQTEPIIISDAGFSDSSLYISSFRKNFYNQKIPVYNVYAFHEVYGVRGKISRLVMLPVRGMASVGEYYQLAGINYICISRFHFSEIGGSLLLQYE